MPNIIEIDSLSIPELDAYARLTEAQLRSRQEPEKGIFIAEGLKVIATRWTRVISRYPFWWNGSTSTARQGIRWTAAAMFPCTPPKARFWKS